MPQSTIKLKSTTLTLRWKGNWKRAKDITLAENGEVFWGPFQTKEIAIPEYVDTPSGSRVKVWWDEWLRMDERGWPVKVPRVWTGFWSVLFERDHSGKSRFTKGLNFFQVFGGIAMILLFFTTDEKNPYVLILGFAYLLAASDYLLLRSRSRKVDKNIRHRISWELALNVIMLIAGLTIVGSIFFWQKQELIALGIGTYFVIVALSYWIRALRRFTAVIAVNIMLFIAILYSSIFLDLDWWVTLAVGVYISITSVITLILKKEQ